MQNFIRLNERALKMLRIHHLNLFHIHRSLYLIFGSPSHWKFGAILTLVSPSATSIQKLDAKIDEYEIILGDESEAFFTLFRLVE